MRSLLLVCLATFPIFAHAANTELRVLFDTDNNAGTGCTVSGMAGVDQVLVTKVSDDGTTAQVTETYRQICAGGVLGGPVDVNTGGWGVGFQPASGKMLVETAIAFSAFGAGSPPPMRIGLAGTRGGASFSVLAQTNGDPIVFPKAPAGRRRAVGHPGTDRVIILDGLDPDWAGLSPIAPGSSGGGASDIKLTQAFAFANPNDSVLYFNYNLNTSGIEAVDDTYVRQQGEGLTEPAPGVLGNDISNGLPLTAVPVGAPEHGDVTLNPDGSFTYTPDDPGSLEPDAFDYKATHGSDESNVATVSIFVEPSYQPPMFTSANSVQLQAGVPANFTVTADGVNPPAIAANGALPAGVTFTDNGDGTATIGGTPANGSGGSYALIFTATNEAGTVNQNFTIIVCNTITVTNPATTTGTAGAAFSQTFTESGAVGGATFTRISGSLPAGLTLDANGTLSGTPTVTGSFPIVVRVTDSNGCIGDGATYNLVIGCPVITVTNPGTSAGTAGAAFSQTFTQTGAIGSATFSTASTLPAGLTLAANGTLSGVPTQTGSFPIVVTVTDSNGCTGSGATYTLVIGCQTITVTNPATSTGTAGAAFSQNFTQTGAIGGATFTTASTLPAGLTLAANGTLSGTPTQTGSFPIVVTVTDGNGCTGTGATYNLVINCQTITVTNPANSNGTVSSAFSETFTQTSAIGGATFTLASGVLPAGLTLATNGVLSGTPTQPGSFPITVTVTDANACTGTSATYNLVIACQVITVTNPANATGPAGSPFSETFTQTGAIGSATFTTSSTLPTGLTLSTAGVLSGTPTQGGTFPITVLVTDANGCTGTSATYNLIITCPTITVTNPANANGTASSAFSETFTSAGGVGASTFTLATGTLPAGLTLAANGVLSGTPTQTGSFPITVTATDSNGCTGTGTTYTLVIACQVITVNNPANGNGTASSAFSETFTQTGAIGSATFTF
nr:putative Ig domain-containing protein [Acidobacteriota bacterium]